MEQNGIQLVEGLRLYGGFDDVFSSRTAHARKTRVRTPAGEDSVAGIRTIYASHIGTDMSPKIPQTIVDGFSFHGPDLVGDWLSLLRSCPSLLL